MSELLSCPFCGGEAEILTAESMHGGNLYGVMCDCCAGRADVYDTEAEAIAAWNTRTPEQAIAATLGRPKAKSHPYGYEPDTGAFDMTRCKCGCLNDISATYCNDCGGEIEIDESSEKEYYDGYSKHTVFAKKHDDGSLEFCERRYVPEDAATLRNRKPTAEQVREAIEKRFDFDVWVPNERWQAIADELNATLGVGESRWYELFGTPERAARTLVDPLICNCVHCDECGARAMCDVACSCPTANDAENALLEWLKQEVNA